MLLLFSLFDFEKQTSFPSSCINFESSVVGGVQASFGAKNGDANAGMGPLVTNLGDLLFPKLQIPIHWRFDLQCSHTNVQSLQV